MNRNDRLIARWQSAAIVCGLLAALCYGMAFAVPAAALLVLGIVFEFGFWTSLIARRRQRRA